ncbi:hypothetical protein BH24ACT23_BH24ACT23_09490 [soil metagenome]
MANHVYVIELAPAAGPRRDPRIPWVYVGSSARDPEIRFAQHRRGYRSARLVKRHALRLRPDLYDDLPEFRGSEAALAAEIARAKELAACGFVAHSDGMSYGKGSGPWSEWGLERAQRVEAHIAAAASGLAGASFEALPAAECARLLYGERGFWVQSFIDPADPPPAYGMFSHVALGALSELASRAL